MAGKTTLLRLEPPANLPPRTASTAPKAKGLTAANAVAEDILDAVQAPKVYQQDNKSWVVRVSSTPATKLDVVALQVRSLPRGGGDADVHTPKSLYRFLTPRTRPARAVRSVRRKSIRQNTGALEGPLARAAQAPAAALRLELRYGSDSGRHKRLNTPSRFPIPIPVPRRRHST